MTARPPEDYFGESLFGLAVFTVVSERLDEFGPFGVRVTKTQVAFRRRVGFAYLWLPGRHLRHPDPEVVLSIALGRKDGSSRWKQVAHPSPKHWMHHLELHDVSDLDDEVTAWLREAYDRAG
jgi:hypothetical protein